jgi:hypothetical protein
LRTGRPKMRQDRVCTMETKALLVHPSYQGVCGRHGTEDDDVTHGDLVMSEISALAGRVGKECIQQRKHQPDKQDRENLCKPHCWQ